MASIKIEGIEVTGSEYLIRDIFPFIMVMAKFQESMGPIVEPEELAYLLKILNIKGGLDGDEQD